MIYFYIASNIPNMQQKRSQKEIEYCQCLAETIMNLRKKSKKSLNGSAFDSLLSPSTLCRIEKNQNTPQITTIAQIANGLGISLSELISETEKNLPKGFSWLD
jgi:transcriptional regulator with XRE-family HTH domain